MRPEIDPKVDYAFKKIFGSESNHAPLMHLLNSVLDLPLGATVRRVRITNPLTEKDFAQEKVSVLDIRAVDQASRHFNVEMQRVVPWVFGKRALYYWAALHSEQLLEGDRDAQPGRLQVLLPVEVQGVEPDLGRLLQHRPRGFLALVPFGCRRPDHRVEASQQTALRQHDETVLGVPRAESSVPDYAPELRSGRHSAAEELTEILGAGRTTVCHPPAIRIHRRPHWMMAAT